MEPADGMAPADGGAPPQGGSIPAPAESAPSQDPVEEGSVESTSPSSGMPVPPPAGTLPVTEMYVESDTSVQTETIEIVLPTIYVTTTIPVTQTGFDWTLITIVGVVAIVISTVLSALKKLSKKKPEGDQKDPCSDIKNRLDSNKQELRDAQHGISLQESVIATLQKKVEDKLTDTVKDKAKDTLSKEGTTERKVVDAVDKAYETYDDVTETLEKAEKLLTVLQEKRKFLTKEADALESSYALCMGDISQGTKASASGLALPLEVPEKKNALILHGTDASSKDNWFPWLKEKLEAKGWKVWVPDLPDASHPSIKTYNEFLLSSPWKFNSASVIIGHSSGATAILGLLQDFPNDLVIDKAILVGAFRTDLGWESLRHFFKEPFDFTKIKKHAKKIIFIHSDDDPHCPLEHAEYLSRELDGELILQPGQKHFSIGTAGKKYREFFSLLSLLEE